MISSGQVHFELLPIEVEPQKLKAFFAQRLKKGISLTQILPTVEKDSVQKVKENVLRLHLKKDLESEFIRAKKSIEEILKWLEYLVEARKQVQSIEILPENESEAVHKLESELNDLLRKMEPVIPAIIEERQKAAHHLRRTLNESVAHMEKQTCARVKKIILKYEKLGKEKYVQAQDSLDVFFKTLKGRIESIAAFIEPKLTEWNTLVLKTGRGFYLHKPTSLPCSLLFTLKGECHLIFEEVGHLVGTGVDKLVLRSVCLPQGTIQALIRPLSFDDIDDVEKERKKEAQFYDMWLETEFLMKLKKKRGIVDLHERMVIPVGDEKSIFLIEDYYWDSTIGSYLKYPIYNKVESARFSPKNQRKILMDLLLGLKEIHKLGILHHDIKPNNILLDLKKKGSKAVIADFQQAVYLTDRNRILALKFSTSWTAPEYAKSQQLSGLSPEEREEVTLKINTLKLDVWGLGIVFYCLIAYELPFWIDVSGGADTESEKEHRQLRQIANLEKGWLPSHLRNSPYFALLERMLQPDPSERCTAAEALQILKAL